MWLSYIIWPVQDILKRERRDRRLDNQTWPGERKTEMEYRSINGLKKQVSRIVFGTAARPMMAGKNADEVLDAAAACGITTFDTARGYGQAEKVLGDWMQRRGNREQLVVITKGCNVGAFGRCRVSRKNILMEMEQSLDALQTDYVDIYLLHRDNPEMPVGDILETLNEMKREGRCKVYGVSNWTEERIQEANQYAKSRGISPIAVSSPHYGLGHQIRDPWGGGCVTLTGPEQAEAREWYRKTQMPVLAYASLGGGFFSGKFRSDDPAGARSAMDGAYRKGYLCPENLERLHRVEILAEIRECTVAQIAIAWLLRQDLNTFAILGASSGARMQENVEALKIALSPEECQWLNLEREEP